MPQASQQPEKFLMLKDSKEAHPRKKLFSVQDAESSSLKTGQSTKTQANGQNGKHKQEDKSHGDAHIAGQGERKTSHIANRKMQTPKKITQSAENDHIGNETPYSVDIQDEDGLGDIEGKKGPQKNKKKMKISHDDDIDERDANQKKIRRLSTKANSSKRECNLVIKADFDLIAKVTEEAVRNIEENPKILKDSVHYCHILDFVRYAQSNPELFPVLSTAEGSHTPVRKIGMKGTCCYVDPQTNKVCGKSVVYQCLECSLEQKQPKYYCVNPNNSDDRKVCFYLHRRDLKRDQRGGKSKVTEEG